MEEDYSSSSVSSSSESSSPAPVNPGIRVRYSVTTPEEHPQVFAYALKVEIVEAIGYPDHLFVFQRSKENTAGDWVDEFIQVASPLDVEEVPENAPDLANNMPYYRSKETTVWFRCIDDLNLAKRRIKEDIIGFTQTYDMLRNGFDTQEEEIYE